MFSQLSFATSRRQRTVRFVSLALHGIALAWLLHSPTPIKLTPNSLTLGQYGKSVTRLYWSSKNPDDSDRSSADAATERYNREHLGGKLTYKKPPQLLKSPAVQSPLTPAEKEDASSTQMLSAQGHGAQAGSALGALYHGSLTGDEVRPALPVQTSDPVVYPWQLPTTAGNEVIEITINERGDIVSKTVLQSLGPDIDDKCLAALEKWRFRPATRNGTAIPSKQDAIFPFHARG
jgi:TonB family protein